MHKHNEQLTRARGLKADILASPGVWIPRREIFLTWLDGFLLRAEANRYELGDTEEADLADLDRFLRSKKVPVAV